MSVLLLGRKHLRSVRTQVCEAGKVLQLDPSQVISQILTEMFSVAPRHQLDLNSCYHGEF